MVKVTACLPGHMCRRRGDRLDGTNTVDNLQLIRRLVRHGTLPQLAAFEAVVRLGSFTRAAERLHMAQPTVSGHVRKLADAVGLPLLELRDRRVVPTAAGQALLDAARDIFAALQRADEALTAARRDFARAESQDDAAPLDLPPGLCVRTSPGAPPCPPAGIDPILPAPGRAGGRTGDTHVAQGHATRLRSTQVWA
jgi:molybdenum-dependent DNA-binding transcriptional regulator ModE